MQRDPDREPDQPIAGRYLVDSVVARTATGVLYGVRAGEGGERFGLKAASASADVSLQRRRRAVLEREFHTLEQLAGPHIVQVHERGEDELGAFYTMQWLGEELPVGRMPWADACGVLAEIAAGLCVIHGNGLVHAGVSRPNLGRASSGPLKLRDFGTLCGAGTRAALPCAAPFVAPEVLQLQAIDARADLFGLGAVAYGLLTGRDAYPAPELEALRDFWRSAVTPPSRLCAELPRALDQLVVRLLSLDRDRRPSSIEEVLEQLRELAASPAPAEGRGGTPARARLVTPRVVGRDGVLTDVRRSVLALLGGTGGALIVSGGAGSGRSRVLDACVLEGKLLGATVVRADASAGSRNDWAVARSICLQLLPELATAFKGFPRHVLGRVIASVQGGEVGPSALASLDRDLVLRELRDFLLALTRGQRLVFAVDDIDRIDEPSAALLAVLAQRADEHGLLVAVTADSLLGFGQEASAALRLLRSVAGTLELEPIGASDMALLLRNMFGASDGWERAGKRLERVAKGNPSAAMEIVRHWVDRRQLRFEQGGWVGPRENAKLPDGVEGIFAARIAQLSPDARELAIALAAADGEPVGLAEYPALTSHGDFARVARALLELVAQRVLIMERETYRFAHPGYIGLLTQLLQEGPRRAVHSALAEQLAHGGHDPWRCARHLLAAGRDREAVELLVRVGVPAHAQQLSFLQRVLAAAVEQRAPARFVHALRRVLLSAGIALLDLECVRSELPLLLGELEAMCGADAFRQGSGLALEQRRSEARAIAQAKYDAAADAERVHAPWEALRGLLSLCLEGSKVALKVFDETFFELLPSLESLTGLSPELDATAEIVAGAREALRGRALQAVAAYERALGHLEERSASAPVEELRGLLRMNARQQLGLLHATLGSREAEQHAQILEAQREFRVAAYRVRATMYVTRGCIAEARKWQRRYELLQLQHAAHSTDVAGDAGFELLAHAFAGDLPGIERGVAQVGALAERYPGWRPAYCLGECHRRWLTGDLAGAVEALGPALEPGLAGRHPHWGHAIAVHVVLLCELDRAQDAVARARAYERVCHRLQVGLGDRWLRQGLAYALGRTGNYAAATALVEKLIEQLEGLGVGGLPLGSAYEIRAKIALYAGDRSAFEHAAQRCADAYFETGNPAMTGKVSQLAEEAAELESPAMA